MAPLSSRGDTTSLKRATTIGDPASPVASTRALVPPPSPDLHGRDPVHITALIPGLAGCPDGRRSSPPGPGGGRRSGLGGRGVAPDRAGSVGVGIRGVSRRGSRRVVAELVPLGAKVADVVGRGGGCEGQVLHTSRPYAERAKYLRGCCSAPASRRRRVGEDLGPDAVVCVDGETEIEVGLTVSRLPRPGAIRPQLCRAKPMPRPSWRRYTRTPRPSPAISCMARWSCAWQSQR